MAREHGLDCPEFWGLQRGEPRSQRLSYSSSPAPSRTRHTVSPAGGPSSHPWCLLHGHGPRTCFQGSWGPDGPSASFHQPRQQALSQDALPSICPRENKLSSPQPLEDQPAGPGVFISAHSDPKSRSTLSATRGQQWPEVQAGRPCFRPLPAWPAGFKAWLCPPPRVLIGRDARVVEQAERIPGEVGRPSWSAAAFSMLRESSCITAHTRASLRKDGK